MTSLKQEEGKVSACVSLEARVSVENGSGETMNEENDSEIDENVLARGLWPPPRVFLRAFVSAFVSLDYDK